MRDIEIPTGTPLVYYLDKETLQPVGRPDQTGFTGELLRTEEVVMPEHEYKSLIHTREVLTLEMLNQEAMRLGLDPKTITVQGGRGNSPSGEDSVERGANGMSNHPNGTEAVTGWRELALKQTGF